MEGKFVDINQPTFLFYEKEREREGGRFFSLLAQGEEISPVGEIKKEVASKRLFPRSCTYVFPSYPSNDV